MAPLPPDSTARLWVDYHTCDEDHTCQIRIADGGSVDDAIADFNALIEAENSLYYLSSFLGARYAASGSNVANPIAGDWPVTWGTDPGPHDSSAVYVDHIGRSLDGRRVRFALFGGTNRSFGAEYRLLAADVAAVAAGVAVLNAAEGEFVSINGFQPVWKPYVNIGENAYWRNKIR